MINRSLSKFATHENSAYPGLWRGCANAWCPSLGPTGSRLFDYSRRQNWGTLTNMDPATDWVVSGGQYALDFDGSNDYVDLSNLTDVYNLARFSVSAWLYYTGSSGENFVYDESANISPFGTSTVLLLRVDANKAQFGRWDNGWSFSTDPNNITASSWQHLCGTFTAGVGTVLYRNGAQVASAATNAQNARTIIARSIGRFSGGAGYFLGQLDDVRVYNRVLDASEIRILASRRGIAFTPRTRRLAPSEQAAGGATPWLYARRPSRIIGGGVS